MYKHCPIILACSGFGMLILGVFCTWYAFPKLIGSALNEEISLEEGHRMYEIWKKQPFPLIFKLYFFNVSNPDEVQYGAKPIVKEIGPYAYDLHVERTNIELNEAEDTLKYMMTKTYFFNQEASGCRSDEDVITIINAALVGTALQVNSLLPSALSMISDAMPYLYPGIKDIFLRVRVKDLLFEGVRLSCQAEEVEFICGAMNGFLPKTVTPAENGKDFLFSMLGYLNATPSGPYIMGRGIKNTTKGELYMFNDEPELNIWAGRTCNMINGSDSGMFFPMKTPVDKIYSFNAEVCRSLYINYEKEINLDGIKRFKFITTFDSLAQSEENKCFCQQTDEDEYSCPKDGLLDMTPCLKAPVYMSFPHFYLADKSLLNYLTGIKPIKEIHESYISIEPMTGTPLEGFKRIQMNIPVKPIEGFNLLDNVTEGMFPIAWFEEGVVLPEKYVSEIKRSFMLLGLLNDFKWSLIILGILVMLSSFILIMYQEKLMCFSNNGKVFITDRNLTFNTSVMYPGLYPQAENKNVRAGITRRANLHNVDVWHVGKVNF